MCALPYYMCTSSSKQHSVLIPPTSNAVSLESLRKFEGGVLGAGRPRGGASRAMFPLLMHVSCCAWHPCRALGP